MGTVGSSHLSVNNSKEEQGATPTLEICSTTPQTSSTSTGRNLVSRTREGMQCQPSKWLSIIDLWSKAVCMTKKSVAWVLYSWHLPLSMPHYVALTCQRTFNHDIVHFYLLLEAGWQKLKFKGGGIICWCTGRGLARGVKELAEAAGLSARQTNRLFPSPSTSHTSCTHLSTAPQYSPFTINFSPVLSSLAGCLRIKSSSQVEGGCELCAKLGISEKSLQQTDHIMIGLPLRVQFNSKLRLNLFLPFKDKFQGNRLHLSNLTNYLKAETERNPC